MSPISSPNSPSSVDTKKKTTNVGAIAGGVVGGIALILVLLLGLFFCRGTSRDETPSLGRCSTAGGEKAGNRTRTRMFNTLVSPFSSGSPALSDSTTSPTSGSSTKTFSPPFVKRPSLLGSQGDNSSQNFSYPSPSFSRHGSGSLAAGGTSNLLDHGNLFRPDLETVREDDSVSGRGSPTTSMTTSGSLFPNPPQSTVSPISTLVPAGSPATAPSPDFKSEDAPQMPSNSHDQSSNEALRAEIAELRSLIISYQAQSRAPNPTRLPSPSPPPSHPGYGIGQTSLIRELTLIRGEIEEIRRHHQDFGALPEYSPPPPGALSGFPVSQTPS